MRRKETFIENCAWRFELDDFDLHWILEIALRKTTPLKKIFNFRIVSDLQKKEDSAQIQEKVLWEESHPGHSVIKHLNHGLLVMIMNQQHLTINSTYRLGFSVLSWVCFSVLVSHSAVRLY